MHRIKKIVAVGDCNTLGGAAHQGEGFPEMLAEMLGGQVVNCGYTMATSREGVHLLRDNIGDADCVCIQFGLVDSYITFRYSPYVLYYPERIWRKPLRALTKKYKKLCRQSGLQGLLGSKNVVAIGEYERNLRAMIEMAKGKIIVLPETIPNKETWRNAEIVRYNSVLEKLSAQYKGCLKINTHDLFLANLHNYYLDSTHCNKAGYQRLAETIYEELIVFPAWRESFAMADNHAKHYCCNEKY